MARARRRPRRRPAHDDADLRAEVELLRVELERQRQRQAEINALVRLVAVEVQRDEGAPRIERLESAVTMLRLSLDEVRRRNDERWKAVGRGFHSLHEVKTAGLEPPTP